MARAHLFAPGSYYYVFNRGTKKMLIYRRESDLWRLLFNLFYFNNVKTAPPHWKRELERLGGPERFEWPEAWGAREPLVAVLGFNLMPNHMHLILKELVEGGVSTFMHRVGMGYAKFINEKYNESGSLFQGTFRSRTVNDDAYLRYLAVYVMVKNAFELYPGGLENALEHFEEAYALAVQSPFNSLAEYAGTRQSLLVERDLLGELFESPQEFKEFARECMLDQLEQMQEIEAVFAL